MHIFNVHTYACNYMHKHDFNSSKIIIYSVRQEMLAKENVSY